MRMMMKTKITMKTGDEDEWADLFVNRYYISLTEDTSRNGRNEGENKNREEKQIQTENLKKATEERGQQK